MEFQFNGFGTASLKTVRRAACLIGLAVLPSIGAAQTNFGSVNVGSASATVAVTVTLQTAGTLGSIAVLTKGAPDLDFTDAGGDTCTVGATYTVGETCTVHVTFKPRYPGPRYGAVELLVSPTSFVPLAIAYVQGIGVGPQALLANSSKAGVYQPSAQVPLGFFGCCEGPLGLAVDGSGNVFVANDENAEVAEILAAGGYTTGKILLQDIGTPTSVVVDGAGNVFLAGAPNLNPSPSEPGPVGPSGLYKVISAGGYIDFYSLKMPTTAVTVNGSGNLFVVSGSQVNEVLVAGGYTTANTLAGGFSALSAIAVDGSGNLFVADEGTNAVYEIEAVGGSIPTSPTIKTIATGFNGPDGLAVDASGNVFVADFYNSAVKEILAAGGYTQILTLYRWSPSPYGVALDDRGNLFIAPQNNLVREMDYADPPSFSFASTEPGSLSTDSPQTVTVFNDGNAGLTFPVPAMGDNPSLSASFLLASTSTCAQTTPSSSTPFTLAEGESCTLAIDFKPESYGAISGSAVLTDDSLNVAGATQTIALSGAGEGSGPLVQLSASSLSFGSVDVDTYSAYQSVTVSNVGNTAVTISSIAVTGTNPSQFVFENTCGTSLAVGAKCTIEGQFGPTSTGAKTAAVTVTDSASGSPQTISLSGTGLPPPVTLSTTSAVFGSVSVGTWSASQWIQMTNTGAVTLSIASITVTGANAAQFSFANTCGSSLAVGANCFIHGHFQPTATGPMTAAITIADNAEGSPQTIALSGTGTAPPLQLPAAVLPLATIGNPFTYSFVASGGVAPYSWSFDGAGPDPGLHLATNGTISGTPTLASACASGASSPWYGSDTPILFSIRVTDAANQTATQQFCMGSYFPTPTVSSIVPGVVTADGASHTITIAGSNFTPTSQVFVGSGSQVVTQFVDSGHLTITLLPTSKGLFAIKQPSSSQLTLVDSEVPTWVVQPVANPGNLNESFTIADPVPSITSITAVLDNSSGPCGPGLYCQFVINGTGLVFDTQIKIVSPSTLLDAATLPSTNLPWTSVTTTPFKLGSAGTITVMITNPNQAGGGTASAQKEFVLTQFVQSSPPLGPIFDPGDSLVSGGQDGHYLDTTPTFLQILSGVVAYNLGLPRATSTQIAIGIGAEPSNASGTVTIPACTVASSCSGVAVSFPPGLNPNVQQTAYGTYNQYQTNLPGTLGGVSGILTCAAGCTVSASGYTFTPNTITAGGTFTTPTWQTDLSVAGIESGTCVMEGGYNNFGSTATEEADIAAMMSMPCAKRGVIQGLPYANTSDQWIGGGADRNAISTLNAWTVATYPGQAVDIDGMFGSVVCPLPVTQADPESVIDCGHGVTPALFRAEDVSGTVTENINSTTCDIPVTGLTGEGAPTFGRGVTMTIGTEKVYVSAYSAGSVTACIRGYASTTAASYSAGQGFTAIDALHLNGPGYQYIAEWDLAAMLAKQQ